jgi:hypothetical protein
MRKIVISLILLSSLLLAACSSTQPQIVLETESFDFGDVVNGDVVSKTLLVRNEGNASLVIDEVSTSCGCTTASLEPMTIPAGGTATLQIEFDSGAHGSDLTGSVVRQIFLTSNDPQQSEIVVEFSANVLEMGGE